MDIDDIIDNELLQFTVYHNSKIKPHLPVAHMDLDIATLREHLDKSQEQMVKFQEKFAAGGSIDFLISMEADDSHRLQRGENVVKIFPKKGHKFKKNYFEQLTFCYHCTNMIWGLTMYQQKAMKCEICSVPVHKRCYQRLLDNCVLAKKLHPEQEKTEIKLGNRHTFKKTQVTIYLGLLCPLTSPLTSLAGLASSLCSPRPVDGSRQESHGLYSVRGSCSLRMRVRKKNRTGGKNMFFFISGRRLEPTAG